ncbi:MAG: hypothetical protein ACLFQB_15210 [Chitinispirillaceae bacterium]
MFSFKIKHVIWISNLVLFLVSAIFAQIPCTPEILKDTGAVKEISALLGLSGLASDAEYRFCVQKAKDTSEVLIVFRNGTQIGELSPEQTEDFLKNHPRLGKKKARTSKKAGLGQFWNKTSFPGILIDKNISFGDKLKALAGLGSWPTGLSFTDNLEIAASRSLITRNTMSFEYIGSLSYVYAGVGYHGSSFHGPLAGELQDDSLNNYDNGSLSWTVGIPFIRYEIKQAGWVVPEYFWLEDDINKLLYENREGSTLKTVKRRWGKDHKGNICHALYMKAGHVRFDMIFDSDTYQNSIIQMGLDSLPFIFGTWGVSLTKASDVWVPGAWIETPKISTTLFSFSGYEIPFFVEPLRFHFHYWNLRRYNVSLQTNMRFDLIAEQTGDTDER